MQNNTLNEQYSRQEKENKKLLILSISLSVIHLFSSFVVETFIEVFFRKRFSCRECL